MKNTLKRLLDLSFVAAASPIAVPLIAASAVFIKLDSPGPVFFTQERLGKNHRPFLVLKLRTMVDKAETLGAGLYAEKNDPRFTRIGLLLRRWSIDELPQLFNVLIGTMSVVGPRPMPEVIVHQYSEAYRIILQVKPGLTGLAQVSGRNELPRSKRLELDKQYAREWTIAADLWILYRTLGVVLHGEGQRNDQGREEVEC